MTQEQHPIAPPDELVRQWLGNFFGSTVTGELSGSERYLATQAARWGADMELEECCEELRGHGLFGAHIDKLRATRRPNSPSLKEQSIALIDKIKGNKEMWDIRELNVIRRALEALPDD